MNLKQVKWLDDSFNYISHQHDNSRAFYQRREKFFILFSESKININNQIMVNLIKISKLPID